MKYPPRNRKKNAKRDPKMSRLFCPLVMEFVPRPYLWFSANPAISRAFVLKFEVGAPQMGQFQSSGRSCGQADPVKPGRCTMPGLKP